MSRYAIILTLVLFSGAMTTAAEHPLPVAQPKPVELLPGIHGKLHHPIATKSREAQQFFDQGLLLIFAFNHPEAERSFRKAAEIDPTSPMPHWGIGYALGPNYNRDADPVGPDRNKLAYEAVQTALTLAKGKPAREAAYVAALTKRYSLDPKADGKKLEAEFKDAMRDLAQKYPDDLDAATLYAESMMNLKPWQLWTADRKPAEGTEEIVRVLENVLRRFPDHPGANHYYIHAMEASPNPERAMPSALRLGALAPGAGHLVHMPAHIYMHTGDYELSARCNQLAAKADEEYFERTGMKQGVYYLMYYPHNIHFIAYSRGEQGRYAEAKQAARKLAAHVQPYVAAMPMLEGFQIIPIYVMLRFHDYDSLLALPEPTEKQVLTKALRHYARCVAFAAQKKPMEAAQERDEFNAAVKQLPAEASFAANPAAKIFEVAATVLDARLAATAKDAIPHWEKAVKLQTELRYGEPPDWYYPIRESLGAAYLRNGQPQEAEAVFRADLERNLRNGRSLYGLWHALKAQNKRYDAECVRREFERAWQGGVPLRIEEY
jgi:tetratricopeptide (TPR) repeat protein